MALSTNEEGWRGIYSLHTKSNRYTHLTKLGQTKAVNSVRLTCSNNMNVGILGGTDEYISVRPMCNG